MRLWALSIFLGALALRLATLGAEAIWYDEAFTAAMTRLPLSDMLGAIQGDVHPPLWYLIESGFVALLGSSPFVLRLPAALASSLAAVQGYELLRGLAGDKSGRLAGILLGILPGQLHYGQDARMYALLTLLVLVGIRLALAHKWLALGAILAVMNWTHNLAPAYTVLFGVWALIGGRRRALPGLLLAAGLTLPWLAPALRQAGQVGVGFWLGGLANVGSALYWLYFTTLFNRLPGWAAFGGFMVSAAVTMVSIYQSARHWRKLWPLALFGFGPAALLTGVSLAWRPVLLDRALLPSGAVVIGLWAAGLPLLSAPLRRVLAAFAAPTASLALVSFFIYGLNTGSPIPAPILARWQEGDALYHMSLTSALITDYYLPDHPAYILPETGDLAQSLSDVTKDHMGLLERQLHVPALAQRGIVRLWVLYDDTPMTSDVEREMFAYLIGRYPVIAEWIYPESPMDTVIVALLDISNASLPGLLPTVPRLCAGARPCLSHP